ncbi:LacI family DNA-binding transcriptional regulator [Thalassospira marina]|uniref:LacI family transcriptional regulator n=1 Tax=Thalassospira marina TaxID=2048283 RepID=A0A2N3KER0_9PROT|nr:LacI family DNA-binding transcriptional regulator [Thalassospira marina]PKR49062.1 LacI family transcriptional regulator [Thalassospira marina]
MAGKRTGPNLTKIGEALGVSSATVSNALSGKGRVSADLVKKIRKKASDMGYVPSNAGRALRTGRSGVLGLVLPDIANPLFPQIAQAMESAASANGYGVLIADSRGEVTTQTDAIGRLIERGVDGLIVIPRRGTRIGTVGCPVAMVDTPSTPGNTVSADHWHGGEQIARHLAGLGHKNILLLGNDPASNVQNDRIGGMRAAFPADISCQTIWLEPILRQGGTTASLNLPDLVKNGVTAIATVSDLLALRVLTELQTAGFRVPAQVSVTGFDDLIFSPVVTPALTTIHMDMAQIAKIAVAALISEITGNRDKKPTPASSKKRTVPDTVMADTSRVPMELIIRSSTGPATPDQTPLPNGETL